MLFYIQSADYPATLNKHHARHARSLRLLYLSFLHCITIDNSISFDENTRRLNVNLLDKGG
jgi:hypothetical protein